jgi:phosphopantothenoylcysteine decarboxylase/phosphopantothenate--cysteine ligase
MLKGKKIVLGITGSIAAYKSCLIIRLLKKAGAEVQVVITPAGKEFITPITLSALSQNPVISDFFAQKDGTWHSHVALGLWADAMLIAPATACTIGKMAHGIADNMLLTTYLSMKAPVFIAPAMDLDMMAHPATEDNLRLLRERGIGVMEAQSGFLASTLEGKGRMEEPENIVQHLSDYFARKEGDLSGKKILITAGPTYEKLDPVRFIGNYSSGKMGYALAEECASRGAQVVLVSGPTSLSAKSALIKCINVENAQEMHDASIREFPGCQAAILCAAVADFTPQNTAEEKIKREGNTLHLDLRPTPDIAATLGRMKQEGQVMVGFALETWDEAAHAREKLERKKLDFIVLNSLRDEGAGFRTDTNKVTMINGNGEESLPLMSKQETATHIVDKLTGLL